MVQETEMFIIPLDKLKPSAFNKGDLSKVWPDRDGFRDLSLKLIDVKCNKEFFKFCLSIIDNQYVNKMAYNAIILYLEKDQEQEIL